MSPESVLTSDSGVASLPRMTEMRIMVFLTWHYTHGYKFFRQILFNYITFIVHYFSISSLLKTLFARFKRMDLTEKRPGLHFDVLIGNLIEGFVSRLIGFIVRSTIIFVGIFALILFLLASLLLNILFLALPFVSYPFYLRDKRGEMVNVKDVREFFITDYGQFFLNKIGVTDPYAVGLLERVDYKNADIQNHPAPMGHPSTGGELIQECFVGERGELFLYLCKNYVPLKTYLSQKNISEEDTKEIAGWYKRVHNFKQKLLRFWSADNLLKLGSLGRDLAYGYTNFLNSYCVDITESYLKKSYYNVYGRDPQLKVLEQSLTQRGSNGVTLITGVKGVGKHSLIYNLAEKIDCHDVPMRLRDKKVLMLNTETFISSFKKEEIPARFIEMLEEGGKAGNTIVVIDAFEKILSGKYGVDLMSIISKVQNYNFPSIVGIMEQVFYNEICAGNDILNSVFTVISVSEITQKETILVLQDFANEAFRNNKISFSYRALVEVAKLADKFLLNEPRPERALAVFSRIVSSVQDGVLITEEVVKKEVSAMVGVPAIGEEDDKKILLNIENLLHQRIIDQTLAIEQISKALRRTRTGVTASKKPSGAFLFLGPTGVGKTETAKALADIYFGGDKYLFRFDMAEFQGAESLERLIGSFGDGKPGILTSTLKNNPFGVLLLDEIEKSTKEVLNLFLTVLDEGYIMDALGNRISCENLIIIATSNAGAEFIRTYLKENKPLEKLRDELIETILKDRTFSPEFLNRFDSVVSYKSLSNEEIKLVVGLMLKKLAERVKNEKGIVVKFREGVLDEVIKNGYDPVFGGRSVKRYIQDNIEDKIATEILSKSPKAGEEIEV